MAIASLVPACPTRVTRGVATALAVGLLAASAACSGGSGDAAAPVTSTSSPPSASVSPSESAGATKSPASPTPSTTDPARAGLRPIVVPGFRYGTVSDLSFLTPGLSATGGLLTSVRGYSVSEGGRPIAALGLYSLAPRARTPAGRYRVLNALMHATDPRADVSHDPLGSIQLWSIVDARGSGVDFYAWSAGDEVGFAGGPNGAQVLHFVIEYLRAAYPGETGA